MSINGYGTMVQTLEREQRRERRERPVRVVVAPSAETVALLMERGRVADDFFSRRSVAVITAIGVSVVVAGLRAFAWYMDTHPERGPVYYMRHIG